MPSHMQSVRFSHDEATGKTEHGVMVVVGHVVVCVGSGVVVDVAD